MRYLFVQNRSGFSEQTLGQPEKFRQVVEKQSSFCGSPIRGRAVAAAARQKMTSAERHEMPTGGAAGMGKRRARC
ncbi:hypothetical protein [Shumkonia mesophila]|uniref:hypothetical protein n=1 Tax=Shumkonia mesophila TaxID=2838854 RepID=UPI0029349410|nr:hypothetical protein [Shumkonia mesophila]